MANEKKITYPEERGFFPSAASLPPRSPPQLRNSVSFESHLESEEKCSRIRIHGFSARGYEGVTNAEFRVAFLRNMKKLWSQVEGEHSSSVLQSESCVCTQIVFSANGKPALTLEPCVLPAPHKTAIYPCIKCIVSAIIIGNSFTDLFCSFSLHTCVLYSTVCPVSF